MYVQKISAQGLIAARAFPSTQAEDFGSRTYRRGVTMQKISAQGLIAAGGGGGSPNPGGRFRLEASSPRGYKAEDFGSRPYRRKISFETLAEDFGTRPYRRRCFQVQNFCKRFWLKAVSLQVLKPLPSFWRKILAQRPYRRKEETKHNGRFQLEGLAAAARTYLGNFQNIASYPYT